MKLPIKVFFRFEITLNGRINEITYKSVFLPLFEQASMYVPFQNLSTDFVDPFWQKTFGIFLKVEEPLPYVLFLCL